MPSPCFLEYLDVQFCSPSPSRLLRGRHSTRETPLPLWASCLRCQFSDQDSVGILGWFRSTFDLLLIESDPCLEEEYSTSWGWIIGAWLLRDQTNPYFRNYHWKRSFEGQVQLRYLRYPCQDLHFNWVSSFYLNILKSLFLSLLIP
jgi:hypothetical protein